MTARMDSRLRGNNMGEPFIIKSPCITSVTSITSLLALAVTRSRLGYYITRRGHLPQAAPQYELRAIKKLCENYF
jgi:hypothetical protein